MLLRDFYVIDHAEPEISPIFAFMYKTSAFDPFWGEWGNVIGWWNEMLRLPQRPRFNRL